MAIPAASLGFYLYYRRLYENKYKSNILADALSWANNLLDVLLRRRPNDFLHKEDQISPIRLINLELLKKREDFPRFPDDANMTEVLEQVDRKSAVVVFISHCWLAGYNGAEDWRGYPHPDNTKNDKFRLCLQGIEKAWKIHAPYMERCYIWLDFGCINQDGDPAGELKQLDKIIQSCDFIFTPIVDPEYSNWEITDVWRGMLVAYNAPAWCRGPYVYLNRAWCRMVTLT